MRRLAVAMVSVVAAFVATGCFRLDVAVDVHADGSGTARQVFAVDRHKAQDVLASDDDLQSMLPRAETISNLPPWARATNYRDGAFEGVAIDFDFPTAADLGPRMQRLTEAITDTVGSAATSRVELRRDGGGWRFEAHQTHLGLAPDSDVLGSGIRARLYDTAELRLTLRLPGPIADSNADRVDGNEAMWVLPTSEDANDLFATSAPPASGLASRPGGTIAIALIVAALGGGLVGAFLLGRSRRPAVASQAVASQAGAGHAVVGQAGEPSASFGPPPAPPAQWPTSPPSAPPLAPPLHPPD